MDPNMHSKSLQRPLIELTHVESIFDHFGGRFLINFGLQNRSKNGSKKSSILGCIFGQIFAEIWLQVGPRRRRHSRKIGVLGGPPAARKRCFHLLSLLAPSWGPFKSKLGQFWDHFGSQNGSQIGFGADLGSQKTDFGSQNGPKIDQKSKKSCFHMALDFGTIFLINLCYVLICYLHFAQNS